MKNDCKRSRIKEFTVYDPNRSDVGNGDGGSRTIIIQDLILQSLWTFGFLAMQNLCKMFFWPCATENAII